MSNVKTVEVVLGGQKRSMGELRVKEMAAFERWLSNRVVTLPCGNDAASIDARIALAIGATFWGEEAQAVIGTVCGQTMLCWLSVSVHNPDVTYDWFAEHVTLDELGEAMKAYNAIHFPENVSAAPTVEEQAAAAT